MKNAAVAVVLGMLAMLLVGCRSASAAATTQPTQPIALQRSRLINDGWRFFKGDAPAASAVAFDDHAWQPVTLPHTWNVADGSDGGNNYYRGPGWYRRSLDVAKADLDAGKRFYLRFGAASLVADVYVNGTHVGQHRGGFAAFCFDVTDQLHAGANSVAVRVDNSHFDDVAPLAGDFTVFGGLYRDVELLVLNPLHISPLDDGSSGVYVKQSAAEPNGTPLEITAIVRNASTSPHRVSLSMMTEESSPPSYSSQTANPAGGRPTYMAQSDQTERIAIAPMSSQTIRKRVVIVEPLLWDGERAPRLTSIYLALEDESGNEVDQIQVTTGVRTIQITPDRGLLLNGQPYAAHGVNIHQEVGGKGWAGSAADYDQHYNLVREMGATCVRMAHYQHNQAEYDACDRLGLLVWTEIPLVNTIGHSPAFAENLRQQLRELIKQNYNHPSVICWGLWNEVGAKADDPNWQLVRDCNALAHELDPSRPTVAASNQPPTWGPTTIPDAIAFNRYTGWYGGQAVQWPNTLAADRNATPGRAIAMSEYGAGGSAFQHELNPARVDQGGPWHPEEYECFVHEQAYRAMKQRPDLWATFLWVMFDFSADQRHEGDHAGRNDKGMVTFDGQTRKDVFYFYQAQWTTRPMVHINSRRYDPYPVGRSTVRVYSNCDEVELIQNGVSLGTQHGTDGIFEFRDVPFDEGNATTIARGRRGGDVVVEDRVERTVSRQASTRTTPQRPTSRPATTRAAN